MDQPIEAAPTPAAAPSGGIRPSLLLGTEPGAAGPAEGPDVEAEILQASAAQLLAGGRYGEGLHIVLVALVAPLVLPAVPNALAVGWFGAIGAAAAGRMWWRRRALALAAAADPEEIIRGARRWALGIGLAWGAGAAALIPLLTLDVTSLILVALSAIVAGATATLVGHRQSFRYFMIAVLAPLPAAILLQSRDRYHLTAAVFIGLFAWATDRIHLRNYRTFVARLRGSIQLRLQEQQAGRERTFLETLFTHAPIAMVVVSQDGRVRGVNARFETLFGYRAEEAVGQVLDDLIVPDTERAAAAQLEASVRRGERIVAETVRRRKDGHAVHVRVSAAAPREGPDAEFLVLYEDFTDRHHAEEALRDAERHFRELVESASDLVWQLDAQGRWTYLNAACERVYGAPDGELLGRPFTERVDPANRSSDQEAFAWVLGGHELTDHETVHLDVAGRPRHLSFAARPLRDAAGNVVGARGIARDVTERVVAREELAAARAAAERAADERSAFLANMSHEIRTPLHAILGMSELLLEGELTEDQRRSLGLVRAAGENLLSMLNDILDLSKLEAQRLALESIPFQLPGLVESVVGLLAVRTRGRPLELLADVDPLLPAFVRGDPTRLRQVLTNLVGNALKFTESGEVIVAARLVERTEDQVLVRIAVRDTGIGIAEEHREQIFREFAQADPSMTRRFGGTGLGLAISRRFVAMMGGRLEVTSAPGKGSEFAFTIPLPIDAARPIAAPETEALRNLRLLVVDDSATNRRIVRELLGAVGVTVDEAADASAALAALRRARDTSTPYHVAVLDGQMPGRDGFALALDVRREPAFADTRLIMLTSAGQPGDARRCAENGIAGYLTKPVAGTELIDTVSAVLAGPAQPGRPSALITRHAIAESRRKLRILLAEDNPVNQEVAASMLRRRGHTVDVVGDGKDAVAAVQRTRYDVVLMDIQMPEMDGRAATRAIRALPAGNDLPILALTAHAMSDERERCLAEGMNGYLSKPFRSHELFAAVEGWGEPGAARPAAPAPPAASAVHLEEFRRSMREAGAEDAVDAILDTFLDSAEENADALHQALAGGEARQIAQRAHAQKSSAATIGAKRLALLLTEIEKLANAGDVEGARARATAHPEALADVVHELRAARSASLAE